MNETGLFIVVYVALWLLSTGYYTGIIVKHFQVYEIFYESEFCDLDRSDTPVIFALAVVVYLVLLPVICAIFTIWQIRYEIKKAVTREKP